MTIDKERLRVLAEAATPGPWILLPVEDGSPYLRVRGTRLGARYKVANVLAPTYFMPRDGIESTANAEFIAAARDAVPALLAENAALAAEVERLRKDAARYQWLRSRLPGSAYRIAGVIYSEGGEGVDAAIDAAMADKGGATS